MHHAALSLCLAGLGSVMAGCGSLPKFQIAIDSEPRGARIEVNREYIGETPLTYTVAGNGDRSFNGSWVQGPMIEFVATPPFAATNLYVHKKSFRPSAFFQQGDHIPEKMLFDLRRKPEVLMLDGRPGPD
jgi:hypothetical protein